MTPTAARRSAPAADTATILFVGNLRDALGGGQVLTIWDEKGRFIGELADVSAFETRVAPGRHTFCSLRPVVPGDACPGGCFVGDFAPGKYYVAWLRYSNEAGQGAIAGWHRRWLFPHPGSKTLTATAALTQAAKLGDMPQVPMFTPALLRGQASLDANPPPTCKATVAEDDINPASWGYDSPP